MINTNKKAPLTAREKVIAQLKEWWNTDCQFCLRARRIIFWLILMLLADYFWFHLLFK